MPGSRLPIGVSLRTIRAEPGWWLESARRLDAAGYAGVWAGTTSWARATRPCRSSRAGRSCRWPPAQTERITVGPFVLNVMNRHPALVARMASTLQIASGGRLDPRHRDRWRAARSTRPTASTSRRRPSASPGSRRPSRSSGRCGPAARSRATRRSTRCTRRTPTRCPNPPPPIIVGGETPAGARLAGRIGDGWSAFDDNFEQNLPLYLESLEAAGRRREDQRVIVGFQGDWLGDESIDGVAVGPGAARDLGALAGGRRRRRDRPRPDDRRHRRPGRGGRALVGARSWHHQPRDSPANRDAAASPDAQPELTHACVRCGAPVAIDVGLCERCNPLGLRDSSASQVHGIAIGGRRPVRGRSWPSSRGSRWRGSGRSRGPWPAPSRTATAWRSP